MRDGRGMTTQTAPRLLAATGILAGVFYYIGGHLLQPSGDPSRRMSDAEIVRWAHESYGALWAGGVVSLLGALLLLVWGVALTDRVDAWAPGPLAGPVARASVQLTAGALGVAGIAQVLSGTGSMPSEHLESESFVPVLAILYGNLAASAWCLLAPAAASVALAAGAPRWIRGLSGASAVLLLASVGLPPVSWPFGMLWVIVTSLCLLATAADVARSAPALTATTANPMGEPDGRGR